MECFTFDHNKAMLMKQGKLSVKQCILMIMEGGRGTASTERVWVHVALRVGNCMTCGVGQKGGGAEGGDTCSRQLQQEALDGLGVQ